MVASRSRSITKIPNIHEEEENKTLRSQVCWGGGEKEE